MRLIRPAITPPLIVVRESHIWRCPCGATYRAGTDKPDPAIFGPWIAVHETHEEGTT